MEVRRANGIPTPRPTLKTHVQCLYCSMMLPKEEYKVRFRHLNDHLNDLQLENEHLRAMQQRWLAMQKITI